MKADAASGKEHPMALKQELAMSIVTDFHSAVEAEKAWDSWDKQHRKGEVPEEAEEVLVEFAEIATAERDGIHLDRLLVRCGLADSRTDAARKLKQGSVRVEAIVRNHHTYQVDPDRLPLRLPIRVGKRIKVAIVR